VRSVDQAIVKEGLVPDRGRKIPEGHLGGSEVPDDADVHERPVQCATRVGERRVG
jgi:hypothetical protein